MYPNNTVDLDDGYRHYRKRFYVEYQYTPNDNQYRCGFFYFPRWNNHTGHVLYENTNDRPNFVKDVYIQLDHGQIVASLNNGVNCWRLYHLSADDDPNTFFTDTQLKGSEFSDPTPQSELLNIYNHLGWYDQFEPSSNVHALKKIYEKRCFIPVPDANVINETVTINRLFAPGDKLLLIFYTVDIIGYLYNNNGTIEVHYDNLSCRHWCYSDVKVSIY